MLALLSPAKKLDFESEWKTGRSTEAAFHEQTEQLVAILKKYSAKQLQNLMKLSDSLATLNHQRYQHFSPKFTSDNARPAIKAFKGDTYVGLDAESLLAKDLTFAQSHIRIISGLYGLLRPLDLMQAYRLEMGTKLKNPEGEDLYDYWGTQLAEACKQAVKRHKDKSIICLASNEYSKAIKKQALASDLITCHFKEMKDGKPRTIGIFAKKARGMMARHMIQNRCETPQELKKFKSDGYKYQAALSDKKNYVFVR